MLLTSFLVLTGFGFFTWLVGHFFSFTGVAAIGAVIVLAVGASVVTTGMQIKTGEEVERDFQTINNSTVAVNETSSATYREVATLTEFSGPVVELSLGGLQMLIGGLLLVQHLNRQSDL